MERLARIALWAKRLFRAEPRICIVIPFFGSWPEWMELFLESCRVNDFVDWIFFTDISHPKTSVPPNVKFKSIRLDEFLKLVERRLQISIRWDIPYKICDLRPAFGVIFEDELKRYEFWGWGDIDVIYGDMRLHLTEDLMSHDCISFSKEHLSGHLCLWRNNEELRYWFHSLPDWKERMESPENSRLDEPSPSLLTEGIRVYAEYSFNTPLSPKTPWTDGTFNCPAEWYWKNGSLTTDIDGDREFLYLHFMHWKGGWWPRHCGNAQWEQLEQLVHVHQGEAKQGFRINARGFFPLGEHRS